VTPIYLSGDCLSLEVSLLRAKYLTRDRPPTLLLRNPELALPLRLILEGFLTQLLLKVKDSSPTDWLFPFLKLVEGLFPQLIEKAIAKQLD
jgi:hypothetical protein